MFGKREAMYSNFSSTSANKASVAFTSSPTCFISAIFALASSLLRFN